MNRIVTLIGSFAYSGFFPFAPATFASLVFTTIYLFVPHGNLLASPYVFFATLVLSVPVSSSMEKRYGRDASCIVIDEVVGMQVIFLGASFGRTGAFLGLLIFRFFDVAKPFPVRSSQKLPGGIGVVCDDTLAAVYSRLLLLFLSHLSPGIGDFSLW